jgi:hypothetical protein
MKQLEKWQWRTLWAGKMRPGKLYYTAEEIMALHPEAEPVPGSMKVFQYPETDEERAAQYQAMSRPPKDFRPE